MPLEVLTITDATGGARARIVPAMGFNCFSFEVPGEGAPVETLWAAPEFTEGTGKPSASGVPLLFPFAGRIRGTSFQFGGKTYELTAGDGRGNAIHGFVLNRPWRVTHRDGNRAAGVFQASVDDPSLLKHWPADFRIAADYRVAGRALVADYTIDNPDSRPLPFGFGTHGYFRVPLGSRASDCRVTVPVTEQWELEGLLPTGKHAPSPIAAELSRGMAASAMQLDHVFGGPRFDNHRLTAKVYDPDSKRTLSMTFDDRFTTCVVFNPPHRQAVCIEPYTTVPDAFWLGEHGVEAHLQVLPPGGSFTTRIEIRVE